MSELNQETKIAVLEERIDVYERMMRRIDSAIEKISENSRNISQMLAVHNEKIDQCNKLDDVILKMIEEIKVNSKQQHDEIKTQLGERIEKIEEKIEDVAQIKWVTIGCGVVLAVIATAVSTLASGWWTPGGMKDARDSQQHIYIK